MPMECCYCGKRAETDRGRTFHKFPWNQPELLQSWLKTMNLGSEFKPLKSMRLCSEHFLEECLIKTGVNVQLHKGSIPSLFGKYKSECVYCSAKKTQGVQRSFHKFPLKNQVLLQKWLVAMGKENYVPNEMSLLCSDHFFATCFRSCKNGASLRLRDSAVPSIFLPVASKDLSVVTRKRKGEPLREIPSAKHLRQDNQCDIVVPSTRECVPTSSMESIFPDEQQQNECMNIDSESIHRSSTNSAATTASNHCRTPTPKNDVPSVNTITHDHHYETTPRSTRRKLVASNAKIKNLQEEVRVQKQKINRLYKRISSLKDIVRELRRTKALPESGLDCLESIAESDVSLFLKRYLKNQKKVGEKLVIRKKRQWKSQRENQNLGISREKYAPALRSFAITLHFYSPRAYGFVRRKFCNALPDPATLRSWYSTIDGEPGFTTESFDALKTKVTEAKNASNEVLVALMLDEMGIKKGIQQISNGSVRGYVDLGSDIGTSGLLPLAKDALVIMAVSLNANWKIPVGYFLVNGIDSTTNSGLVTDCLIRLNDIGVKVVSVTLDGPPQHFSTMRLLGANFTMPNPKPFFLHPSTGEKVFVMFDACHMLKLVRNCFGNVKVMKDLDGNLIEWRFVTALAHLQQTEGLRAGNRLRSAHIRYERMKMKVALAAQTMSSSVADSISFCDQTLHLLQFKGSDSTVKFIRCVDHLFDFLNSRNPFARGFKAPLRRSNEIFWRQKISEEIEYFKGITDVSGRPIWSTPKYVPFVGFVTGVMSVIEIFDMYVKPEGSQLKYLLTYKLSQDHLELFFCAIRSCGGWCPNPTCTQFVSAYKRLLIHHEVAATNGNAEAMDGTRVLFVSSGTSRVQRVDRYDPDVYDAMSNIRVAKKYGLDDQDNDDSSADNFMDEFLKFHGRLPESLSNFSRTCIGNIAGWVVRKLVDERRPMVKCEKCRVALFQTSQTRAEFEDNALIEAKTRGGLLFPSTSVVLICQRAEEILRHALNKNRCMTPKESNFPAVACAKVIEDLLQNPEILFPSLNEHIFDDAVEELSSHVYSLAKNVCKTYIKLRLFAATSLASEAAIGTKLRHHMTRQIIWNCQ